MNNEQKFSQVNHPDYYQTGRKECIVAMEEVFGPEEVAIFCKLSAFKYKYREGDKGPAEVDQKKAQWYMDHYISTRNPATQPDMYLDDIQMLIGQYK